MFGGTRKSARSPTRKSASHSSSNHSAGPVPSAAVLSPSRRSSRIAAQSQPPPSPAKSTVSASSKSSDLGSTFDSSKQHGAASFNRLVTKHGVQVRGKPGFESAAETEEFSEEDMSVLTQSQNKRVITKYGVKVAAAAVAPGRRSTHGTVDEDDSLPILTRSQNKRIMTKHAVILPASVVEPDKANVSEDVSIDSIPILSKSQNKRIMTRHAEKIPAALVEQTSDSENGEEPPLSRSGIKRAITNHGTTFTATEVRAAKEAEASTSRQFRGETKKAAKGDELPAFAMPKIPARRRLSMSSADGQNANDEKSFTNSTPVRDAPKKKFGFDSFAMTPIPPSTALRNAKRRPSYPRIEEVSEGKRGSTSGPAPLVFPDSSASEASQSVSKSKTNGSRKSRSLVSGASDSISKKGVDLEAFESSDTDETEETPRPWRKGTRKLIPAMQMDVYDDEDEEAEDALATASPGTGNVSLRRSQPLDTNEQEKSEIEKKARQKTLELSYSLPKVTTGNTAIKNASSGHSQQLSSNENSGRVSEPESKARERKSAAKASTASTKPTTTKDVSSRRSQRLRSDEDDEAEVKQDAHGRKPSVVNTLKTSVKHDTAKKASFRRALLPSWSSSEESESEEEAVPSNVLRVPTRKILGPEGVARRSPVKTATDKPTTVPEKLNDKLSSDERPPTKLGSLAAKDIVDQNTSKMSNDQGDERGADVEEPVLVSGDEELEQGHEESGRRPSPAKKARTPKKSKSEEAKRRPSSPLQTSQQSGKTINILFDGFDKEELNAAEKISVRRTVSKAQALRTRSAHHLHLSDSSSESDEVSSYCLPSKKKDGRVSSMTASEVYAGVLSQASKASAFGGSQSQASASQREEAPAPSQPESVANLVELPSKSKPKQSISRPTAATLSNIVEDEAVRSDSEDDELKLLEMTVYPGLKLDSAEVADAEPADKDDDTGDDEGDSDVSEVEADELKQPDRSGSARNLDSPLKRSMWNAAERAKPPSKSSTPGRQSLGKQLKKSYPSLSRSRITSENGSANANASVAQLSAQESFDLLRASLADVAEPGPSRRIAHQGAVTLNPKAAQKRVKPEQDSRWDRQVASLAKKKRSKAPVNMFSNANMLSREKMVGYLMAAGEDMSKVELDKTHIVANTMIQKFLDKLCASTANPNGLFTYRELEQALHAQGWISGKKNMLALEFAAAFTPEQLQKMQGTLIPNPGEDDTNF